MTDGFAESQGAFRDAAQWFLGVVARVDGRWDRPGLGEWDVRALVGHTSRSFLTVETYLGRPAVGVEIASAADYFRATRKIAAGTAVTQRGREAGAALGEDPAGAVAEIAARVVRLVDDKDGTELVTTVVGGMRLSDYLPTRTFELVVHGADLTTALGVPADVPPSAAGQSLRIVIELAVEGGQAAALLLAATGRGAAATGLTVL